MKPIKQLPVIASCSAVVLIGALSSNVDARVAPDGPAAHSPPAIARRLPLPGDYNVLVIVLDDLGTDWLKMYADDPGPPYYCTAAQVTDVVTPNLDMLRSQGILFTRCYVYPMCSPSRAAMLTGRYARRTGMGEQIDKSETPGYELPLSEECFPELIRDVNPVAYKRGAFGKWHMTDYFIDDCHAADCGYELFEGEMGNPDSHYDIRKVTSMGGTIAGCTSTSSQEIPVITGQTPDETIWDAGVTRVDAEAWINGLAPTDHFVAYVAFSPPHDPWQVPPFSTLSTRTQGRLASLGYEAGDEFDKPPHQGHPRDILLIYRAMIESLDWEIGQLLADIPGVLAKTMVIVMDDNGTPSNVIIDPAVTNHGKRTLFELGTRAPLIVTGPLVTSPGSTCRQLVSAVDLWRTVANITGVSNTDIDTFMTGTPVDSVSFLNLIQNPSGGPVRHFAYSEAFKNAPPTPPNAGYQRGITDGSFRYMRSWKDSGMTEVENLYHTAVDPCEQSDLLLPSHTLTGDESTALAALRAAMDAIGI